MHFGRVDNFDGRQLSLPPDTVRTARFLALPRDHVTKVYIGCPIWAVRSWVGPLYPPGTPNSDYLKEYAKSFNTVEINSTFYHLLDPKRLAHWQSQVPSEFRFCPKVFRGITEQLSSPQLPQLIGEFCNTIRVLGPNLGLTFAQLPDSVSPKLAPLVSRLISHWPKDIPLAVEFRHPDWFKQHALLDDAINFLYRNGVASVITDTTGRRDALHSSLTQPQVMIRFQGNKLDPSDLTRLEEWSKRIHQWTLGHIQDIYFFTHQPEDTLIPKTATLMSQICMKTLQISH